MNKKIITIITAALCVVHLNAQVNSTENSQQEEIISGCQAEDYVILDVETPMIETSGFSYTPKCLKILVGTQVMLSASRHHPLAPQAQENNPITASQSPVTITFEQPGVFGYFCERHGNATGQGMAGAIQVVNSFEEEMLGE